MPANNPLRISLIDAQGKPLGGIVDLVFTPQGRTGAPITVKAVDASKDIEISAQQAVPAGQYQLTIRAADGTSTSHAVTIADSPAPIKVVTEPTVVAPPVVPPPIVIIPKNSLKGILTFDTGFAASGITTRAYHIAFGGQAVKLGEAVSDATGAYAISYIPPASPVNIQVRVVDSTNAEITISAIKYKASTAETLNLVVPSSVKPAVSEFSRLSADLTKSVGDLTKLAQAQETSAQQDLTLLRQSISWDARLIALAAIAVQQAAPSGVGQDVLYALYRVGLPTDPALLSTVPVATIQAALQKASDAGIVQFNDQQMAAAVKAMQNFSTNTLLASTAPGTVSSFKDILTPVFKDNAAQLTAFANLYFSQGPSSTGDFWAQAAKLDIAPAVIDSLKTQGKLLYLTSNNAPLTQKLQQTIGAATDLGQLAEQDLHKPSTWQETLTALAGQGGDKALDALIPSAYTGATTADRAAAYAGDLARRVRMSFPTQVTARMVENKELAVDQASAQTVTTFLKKASSLGYSLGRTPLNRFIKASGADIPKLDDASASQVKTLHRLYQVTPSTESLQAAAELGFKSAHDITKYSESDFLAKYESAFPAGEALIVYQQSRTVSSVTFNVFATAKALDTQAPVFASSGSADDRQQAKNSLVEQFPSMASLFGNLDFCQCEDCRSVLSPAAYFVDVLDLLGDNSAANAQGYKPLDVLIGKDALVPGRRPDLGALPLTCENTNTALPYIDLVNEIFEYYVAHSTLDAGVAYNTGSASTDDLNAEPQHILPDVYTTTLKQAVYPLNLPFDLWIETVRGFLDYFKIPLATLLDTFRQANTLELFTGPPATPYFRSQILAESLSIAPSEYAVFTSATPANWFQLYGAYANEAAALADLKSAKTLSLKMGISYQDVTDLVQTGFLNPGIYPLIFQFERFDISMADAFSYTGQPGFPALTAQQKTDFEVKFDKITAGYLLQNPTSTFDAKTWLGTLLPAGYSKKVLVLADPDSGCNFTSTTLQYADGSAAAPLDLLKFNLFVRLWKKLGWSMDEVDRALQAFFPANLPAWNDAGFSNASAVAWKTALVYLAHLDDLNTQLSPAGGRNALLPLWGNLSTQGNSPLYSQLFLTSSILNNDSALDDPGGSFPWPAADLKAELRVFSAHSAAIQGALGLSSDEITAILADANVAAPAAFNMANISICYRYSLLAQCLEMSVADLIALRILSGLNPFQPVSGTSITTLAQDVLLNQTLAFVRQAGVVENSGFSLEDLKYLLRHQFDPVGKYQSDPNAFITLVQSVVTGLLQIHAQNSTAPDLMSQAESLIDQKLSGLVPAAILKTLIGHLTNSQTYTASKSAVPAAIDPAGFAQEPTLTFAYDAVTQTQSVSYKGLLTDWKKSQLETINNTALFAGLLNGVQQQAHDALAASVSDLLGVWASLVQYEAVETPVAPAAAISDPLNQLAIDAALSFTYDQSDQLQWLGYRGVLTDQKLNAVTALNNSAPLAALLSKIQQQALPAYKELTGSLLAMWTNGQIYVASTTPVAPANQIDQAAFAAAFATAQQNGVIVDPVPPIQFSYDAASQTQTLTCQGILADSMRGSLSALLPSPVLANLLQAARNQAVQLFQNLAANLLTVAPADLDAYAKPYLGASLSNGQRLAKAELVKTYSPLLDRKLSRQFILQTLSTGLAADPSLVEALVTDAALLNDPSNPGRSLLDTFLAISQTAATATYYASADQSGAVLASGLAVTVDTHDPSNNVPGMHSCRFEGYLQVPTDGPYCFFAELGNNNAQCVFHIDSPDPASLIQNPVIQQTATQDGYEASQFVNLKGGVAYHYTADFKTLGAAGASMLIQGETLPKGPLSQIQLYAQSSVSRFSRAWILLSKVLQILQTTAIGERELSYMVANSSQFSNLRLSSLPTQPSDDSPAKAVVLFAQFRSLADYADLRKGPAGGSDGLIDVFQAASLAAPPVSPSTILANLTRRDAATVAAVATALGPEPLFTNTVGIRRIWDALQLVQILGLPVASISAATAIVNAAPVNPDQIAANFKNAVKAQYTPDQWRPVAKSVFDVLRRRKRDALVSFLVNKLGLQNSNQLFEYFLIDPGMEPVVQTSRLRLAMSSLQTFVQRCLLNLENENTAQPARNVSPSAIDSDWWDWMKRYRVWQANREIFLFPENWMEPELRLDKTDLFQALEGDLLQGDVTRDLVEDAFLTYLKGLDVRARLDIVASYFDQDTASPGHSTLYVLGRTYGLPHKYFHRTYQDGSWSGWQAITLDIEGDHIVAAIWRGRLNVFWLTFVAKTQAPAPTSSHSGGAVSALDFGSLASDIFSGTPQKQVQVQLHWSEFVQGKWTTRISSDVEKTELISVSDDFDIRSVHVHITKELAADGNEGAIRIHLDFPAAYERDYLNKLAYLMEEYVWDLQYRHGATATDQVAIVNLPRANHAFRVTSKNCSPDFRSSYWLAPQNYPYNTCGIDATRYTGSSNLAATFQTHIQNSSTSTTDTEKILNSVTNFEILPPSNPVAASFLSANEPLLSDAGGLVAPIFFKDTSNPGAGATSAFRDERTFFVEPSLTETVIQQWEYWAVQPPSANHFADPGILKQIDVVAQVPEYIGPVNPGDPVYSIGSIRDVVDWATNPVTAINFGNSVIGKTGGIQATVANLAGDAVENTGIRNAAPGLSVVGREGLGISQIQILQNSLHVTLNNQAVDINQ
jgi:hypothetical protein